MSAGFFQMRVTPDDLQRWRSTADFRGFRRNGTGDLSKWLKSLANADVHKAEAEIAGGSAPAADTREQVKQIRETVERRQAGPRFRLAPPCDHVPLGLFCERCGERRSA